MLTREAEGGVLLQFKTSKSQDSKGYITKPGLKQANKISIFCILDKESEPWKKSTIYSYDIIPFKNGKLNIKTCLIEA